MPDYAKIRRNLDRMKAGGAEVPEVQQYLETEGVTLQEVMSQPPDAGSGIGDTIQHYGERGANFVKNVVGDLTRPAVEAFQGQQDPRFAGVPSVDENPTEHQGLATQGQFAEGFRGATGTGTMALGNSDEQYYDLMVENLGDRFIPTVDGKPKRDANGYLLIDYVDPDGQIRTEYVNKPGADMQDLDRGLAQEVPMLAAGGMAGGAARRAGYGLLKGLGLVGASQVAGSEAMDALATTQGSEQGQDHVRAALSGALVGLGGVGKKTGAAMGAGYAGVNAFSDEEDTTAEKIGKVATGLAVGYGAGKVIGGTGLPKGQTSPDEALEQANKQLPRHQQQHLRTGEIDLENPGINPESIEIVQDQVQDALNVSEVMDHGKAMRKGYSVTQGQISNDPAQLLLEDKMRKGGFGPTNARELLENDQVRQMQIREGAMGPIFADARSLKGEGVGEILAKRNLNPETDSHLIRSTVDGMTNQRGVAANTSVQPANVGEDIRKNFQGFEGTVRAKENELWKGLDDVVATSDGMALLKGTLERELGPKGIRLARTGPAREMLEELRHFAEPKSGQAPPAADGWLDKPGDVLTINQMRETIGGMVDDAATTKERRAAGQVYRAYNAWIDEISAKSFVEGEDAAALASRMRGARAFTREFRGLLNPKDSMGKATPGGAIMKQLKKADSAENFAAVLFGRQTTTTAPTAGRVEALENIKKMIFSDFGKSSMAERQSAWNDIRIAYWSKIVLDKKGHMKTPGQLQSDLVATWKNQNSIMKLLYDKKELAVIADFVGDLDVLKRSKDGLDVSGVAKHVMDQATKSRWSMGLKKQLQIKGTRERLGKGRVYVAAFYQMLAGKLGDDWAGALTGQQVRKALSPTVKKKITRDQVARGVVGGMLGRQVEGSKTEGQR